MFTKILIANRGEIAVRIVRTCRDLGLATVALYEPPDMTSLHVRLADECAVLDSPLGFLDQEAILALARAHGADAIHPGYGFLAGRAGFARACSAAGITFIGPPPEVLERLHHKQETLARVAAAGIPAVPHSPDSFGPDDFPALKEEAERLGYPLVVKSYWGGRGRGTRLVSQPSRLAEAVRRARAETIRYYDDDRLYLEPLLAPAHQIAVQVLADVHGGIIHLGEREGSLIYTNQKLFEETPAPCLTPAQRARLWDMSLQVAELCNLQNAASVEFLQDGDGNLFFSEIKPRIQSAHLITEMISGVDIVREQIRLATGEPLSLGQDDVRLDGWAIAAQINAEDPWNDYLPSPGRMRRVRLPGGPGIRVDTYIYDDCDVPPTYDPLIARVAAWGPDRTAAVARLRRALEDLVLVGTSTNISLLQRILHAHRVAAGEYDTLFLLHPFEEEEAPPDYLRDLAAIAAILYLRRHQPSTPELPERFRLSWHRHSRRLPS